MKRVRQALQEGRKLVGSRLKLILIADRSEHGWEVVKRYEADDLADDSEDKKKLKKAEKAAEKAAEERAANKRKAGKGTRRPGPYGRPGGAPGQRESWWEPRPPLLPPWVSGNSNTRPKLEPHGHQEGHQS